MIYLDEDRTWFRLHHLIREILNKRLFQIYPSDQIEKYYKKAGAYFASQNYFEEGIQYSVLGKDIDLVVKIITSNWEKLIDQGENLRLSRWLNMLPAGTQNTDPMLLVSRAYLCDTFGDFDAMKNYLENASKNINEQTADPRLLGAFASVHSCFSAYTYDLPAALKFANQALDTLLPDQEFLRDYALNFKVIATSMIQSPAEAKALIDNYELKPLLKGDRHIMRINVIKLLFNWNQANPKNLKHSAKIVLDICKQEKVWWMYKMGCYYHGQFYYMNNQINEAYTYFDSGIDCFFNAGPIWALQLYYSGALTALAENDQAKAHNYLDAAKKFVELNNLQAFEGYLRAFEVEFALRINDVEKAWELNGTANYSLHHPPIYYYYIPQFTQVKLYIKKGDPDLMKEAYALIQQYKKACERIPYAHIQITLLEAIWFDKSGMHERAIGALSELLTLTPEDNYIRVFLDMGQAIKKMMSKLSEEQKQTPLALNIMMAFRYEQNLPPPDPGSIHLTSKEMELMELVASGLQNKEIADQLCLSDSTIKTYLYRIYKKLEVKNRFSAIQKINGIKSQSRTLDS